MTEQQMLEHPGILTQKTELLREFVDYCKKLLRVEGVLQSALGKEGTGIDMGIVIGGDVAFLSGRKANRY